MRNALTRLGALTAVLLCGLLAAPAAHAVDPEVELIEISGPAAMLERGLPADNPPIFAAVADPDAEAIEFGAPDDYGTDDFVHYTVMGHAFVAANSDATWGSTGGSALYCRSGSTYEYFDGQLHVPVGSEIDGIRSWTYDSHASEDMHLFLWEICQPEFGAGTPATTELLDVDVSSGASGEQSQFNGFAARTANTVGCTYRIRARFGLANNCDGSSIRLHKVRIQFKRQVSPAPGTASFGDVPTGHPFFQHVEALVDSGITAGCGGGNYCPNDSLTRGQMAVFLAKALGLHWSQHDF